VTSGKPFIISDKATDCMHEFFWKYEVFYCHCVITPKVIFCGRCRCVLEINFCCDVSKVYRLKWKQYASLIKRQKWQNISFYALVNIFWTYNLEIVLARRMIRLRKYRGFLPWDLVKSVCSKRGKNFVLVCVD
jgi:hypothetical protein